MDCSQAEFAMMEHMEQTIKPQRAANLAKHLLSCEACREYYMGIDMAMEVLEDTELSAPPEGFTQAVMAQVKQLPAYEPPAPVPTISTALRVLWGLSAIVIGVGLLLVFNPDLLAAVMATPFVANIVSAVSTVWQFAAGLFEGIPGQVGYSGGLSLFNVALAFAGVIVVLLIVLQISEKKSSNS